MFSIISIFLKKVKRKMTIVSAHRENVPFNSTGRMSPHDMSLRVPIGTKQSHLFKKKRGLPRSLRSLAMTEGGRLLTIITVGYANKCIQVT